MKVSCINLRRSVQRRAKMETELKRLRHPYEFIEAVDGRDLRPDEIKGFYSSWCTRFRQGIDLTPNELGCALSHKRFFEHVRNSLEGSGVVLEDDVSLSQDFNEALDEIDMFLSQQTLPTLVQLPGIARDLPKGVTAGCFKVASAMGAYAYAINRAAAELLLKAYSPVRMTIDKYNYLIKHYGLQFYVYPKLVLSVDMMCESEIGLNRVHFTGVRMFIYKIWRCVGVVLDALLSFNEWC